MTIRRSDRAISALVAILLTTGIVFAAVSAALATSHHPEDGLVGKGQVVSSITASNGIELVVTVAPAVLVSGMHLNVSVNFINTLPKSNNVTIPRDWALPALIGPCGPIGLANSAFYSGNYSLANIASATPLPSSGPGEPLCPAWNLPYVVFQPSSNIFTYASTQYPNDSGGFSQYTGYYSSSQNAFVNFSSRVYTLVVGDTWGSLVFVHFRVA